MVLSEEDIEALKIKFVTREELEKALEKININQRENNVELSNKLNKRLDDFSIESERQYESIKTMLEQKSQLEDKLIINDLENFKESQKTKCTDHFQLIDQKYENIKSDIENIKRNRSNLIAWGITFVITIINILSRLIKW